MDNSHVSLPLCSSNVYNRAQSTGFSRDEMKLSEIFRRQFPSRVRQRGLRYFKEGRVDIVDVYDWVLSAVVRGTDDYRVVLEATHDASCLNWSCTCPYFFDRGPCKHIWATMLHVQAEALLPDTEGLDNTWHPGGMQFDDGGEYEERFKNMRLSTPKQREPASWRTAMHAIRNTDLSPQPTNEYPGTRYRYIVGMAETMRENGLVLHVTKTRPKKNGGWTKQKPVRLESNSADRIADPEDRRFLTLLEGGSPTDSYYYDSWGSDGVYHLSGTLMEILLPDLASSGRLYLAADAYDTADALPITLDEGYPWQFRLHVNKEEELKRYVVSGMLSRGKEGMQLKEPRMLLSSGWMFYDNRLARLDHSGAFEWIPLLRRNNQLVVPENEATDWLQSFISCPRVPPVTLPEELRFERIAVTPKPLLKLYAAKQNVDGVYLGGVLHFDYDGACLPFASDIPAFFDADKRRVIDRSLKDERAAVDRLSTLRFRMARPFYKDAYPEPCDFEIPTRHFVAAAVALVQEGWHVEADGKRYRSAGSVSLSVSSGMDWFDVNGDVDFGSAKATLPELLKALKKGSQSIVLDDGTMGILPATWLKRYGFLGNVGQTEGEAIRFSRTQASLLDALLAAEPEATFDEGFTQMCKELHTFTSVEPANPPKSFRGTLRDYQREGLGWLGFLQRFRFGGCLADDMGLGKTIQALAVLETRRSRRKGENRDEKRPSLAVVPRSLVFNWKQEADRFAPRLKVLDHSGVGRDGDLERFGNYDLVLTTYGTLRSDILKLKDVEFDYVILDEAQAIKNPATSTAKAARLLKARHRLAMSGTPIENHLGELWSLFEFLNPGMLGTASAFKRGLKAAQNGDEENVRMLSRAVRPFVLRRTKSQVAKDLPEKMEETIYCELIPAHRKQYDQLRDHYRQALLAKVDGDGMAKSKIMVLEALLRLRQAACHPGLLDRSKITRSSAKLDVLLRQIQDVMDEDHKILVFSQFTSLLAIVRGHLDKMAVTYAYLDGKTRKREAVVERFQNDPACKVFIISLKAGGLGLNLTAADYVVLLDPWWNPAVEAQAIDRTHRIGQTRRVFAYRIVARDTVEERILELQQKKKKLADSIITADNSLIRTLTRKDLELLLA